jgi:hypothetical protein
VRRALNALRALPSAIFSPPKQAGYARLKMEITDGGAVRDTDKKMDNRVERTYIKMFMIFQNM